MVYVLRPPRTWARAAGLCVLVWGLAVLDGAFVTAKAAPAAVKSKTLVSYSRSVSGKGLRAVSLKSANSSRRVSGLNRKLRGLLARIERHYKRPVMVSSGCRSKKRNRRIGGARRSYHLRCMAADIKVAGVSERALLRFVRRLPGRGGVGTYCRNSIVHIDVGPRREWHQRCRRRKRK